MKKKLFLRITMSGVVAVGLVFSAIGFGGKYAAEQIPKITSKMRQILKSISVKDATNKYYKGGFEPSMTKREARLILGISGADNRLKTKEAHKRIILLNHPDRGGSPYLAAKINEAKEYIESCKP